MTPYGNAEDHVNPQGQRDWQCPGQEQFQKEWAKLDARGEQRVNRDQHLGFDSLNLNGSTKAIPKGLGFQVLYTVYVERMFKKCSFFN